jgi:hypothetical protein
VPQDEGARVNHCASRHPHTLPTITGKAYTVPAYLKPVPLTETNMARLMQRLLGMHSPQAIKWLRAVWASQGKAITQEQIAAMLSTGRVPVAVQEAVRASYETFVKEQIATLQGKMAEGIGSGFARGTAQRMTWAVSTRLLEKLAQRQDRLAQELSQGAKDTLQWLTDYYTMSNPVPQGVFANRIQEFVGLLDRETRAVTNVEKALIAAGHSPAVVEKQVAQYKELLLRNRAQRIARTELAFASSKANREALEQAREQGLVVGRIVRRWDASGENVCEVCDALDGTYAEEGGAFDGGYDDPPAHPACACVSVAEQLIEE